MANYKLKTAVYVGRCVSCFKIHTKVMKHFLRFDEKKHFVLSTLEVSIISFVIV